MTGISDDFNTDEIIHKIAERLLETRKKAEIILKPHTKNEAQFVSKRMYAEKEIVNLERVFPSAEIGDSCYVSFNLSSDDEASAYIKINEGNEVYYCGKKVYPSLSDELLYVDDNDGYRYVHIPITVDSTLRRVDIKSTKNNNEFAFRYIISSNIYPFMWAKDYLLHIKRTIPIKEYQNEDGIAISALFSGERTADSVDYVFPSHTIKDNYKNFFNIVANKNTYIGYAYSEAIKAGKVRIHNSSPIKVFINGRLGYQSENSIDFELDLKKGDKILIKSQKAGVKWGFECEDTAFSSKKIYSDRNYGDKWLLIGGFGKASGIEQIYGPEMNLCFDKIYRNEFGEALFWRLQDGSFVRPYLDSFFFGQWYDAVILGHWGLLKASRYMKNNVWQEYFLDSISVIGSWFEYMKYDYENLHIVAPFLQRSMILDNMDSIGVVGTNLADCYLISSEPRMLNTKPNRNNVVGRFIYGGSVYCKAWQTL